MTRLPCRSRSRPGQPATDFLRLAACSRSAQELIAGRLHRPVVARLVSNVVLTPSKPYPALRLAAGEQPVRLVEHLLLDGRAPYPPVGFSSAAVVAARLPSEIRGPMRRGEDTIAALLEQAGGFWQAETHTVEQLCAADASNGFGHGQHLLTVRLTRLLYLLGDPVAIVVEDIPEPAPAPPAGGGRSPPT